MGSSRISLRSSSFPVGLRVLVVDNDPTWLNILEKMLKKCNYEATTCNLAQKALDLLQEREDGFDIIISDVNMTDMDGFKFLEHVGRQMDLPVIMMSVDGETTRVMKGVQHGACDYLLKPIRMKELRNIWQHVFRKRIHEARGTEDDIQIMRNGKEQSNDACLFSRDMISSTKRKDIDNKNKERECGDTFSVKKARVVWTVDLHQKFVKAVNQIGFEKVGPKKILDLMGVPWLTRENIASHLQKYRLYLSRLQEENELKAACGGIKLSDIPSKDPVGNICLQSAVNQNSVTLQKNIMINENYAIPGQEIHIHNHGANIYEGKDSGILSMAIAAEQKKPVFGDVTDSPISCTSRIGYNHSFELLDSEVKAKSKFQTHYTLSAKVPSIQLEQKFKPHFQSQHQFNHFPLPIPHIQVDFVSYNPRHLSSESDKPTEANISPSYTNSICYATGAENKAALLSFQPQRNLTNGHIFKPIPCSMWSTKNYNLQENLHDNLEPCLENIIVGTRTALRLHDAEFNGYSFPAGDLHPLNPQLVNLESFGYSNQELIADVRSHSYDTENLDSEYPIDPVDLVINQGIYFA